MRRNLLVRNGLRELGDTGLEPLTSCVSGRPSTPGPALTTPRTAFFGLKTGVGEPVTVALRRRYPGLTELLTPNRHRIRSRRTPRFLPKLQVVITDVII